MSLAVGIDLGTSNSCVAVFHSDRPECIELEGGSRIIPSVVYYNGSKPTVGHTKYARIPQNLISGVKFLIGRKYVDTKSLHEQFKCNYNIFLNKNNEVLIAVKGSEDKIDYKTPSEISAEVLKTLTEAARNKLENFPGKVVITVPAYFKNDQRAATIKAGELAGLKVIRLLNEPTAAALAYAYRYIEKGVRKLIAVYDFGGGTFDISIIELHGKNVTVKAIAGDCNLGGKNINEVLMSKLKKHIIDKYNVDVDQVEIKKRYRILERMENGCEELKKTLSIAKSAEFVLDAFCGFDDVVFNIKRQEFENDIKGIVEKTMHIVDECFKEANLTFTDIDEILLVGGSARIPLVQHYLKQKFGEEKISKKENLDEVVAEGAAIQAAMLSDNPSESVNEIRLTDVLAMSLGTATKGKKMSVLIRRNTKLPAENSRTYRTLHDNQTCMTIEVFEGENPISSENTLLKKMVVDGITPARAGEVYVTVTFFVDENGILSVTAIEKNNKGNVHSLKISLNRGAYRYSN